VDVHHFKLLDKLREIALAPQDYGHGPERVTDYESLHWLPHLRGSLPTGYINMVLGTWTLCF
jgi:hypothetical protein